ncbi:ComEC/Rec2 family competence protein [Alkaliphilus oremlandii]|uniref:Beta-lactamase domain protein n=1 Tax=Alkaliphilus oremlandii (strain OhILAs) TaxID=350688 RepID=A8MF29_ALKOO|nr:ComEC/Rec2 family competence protein [Alkaliphilus oremlandii]ABW18698.1 beta-lactamase domain protein [Alkaliphilus oremlandii OhILAs]
MSIKKIWSMILILSLVMAVLVGCGEISQETVGKGLDILTQIVEEELSKAEDTGAIEENITEQETAGEGNLQVHVIDIGQGSANFIVGADGKTMLYDAGGEDSSSGRVVVDYIKSLGYEKIDVAVFTHPHADHINGAPTIFKELKVESVYYPKVTHNTKTFENFANAVQNAGLKFKTAKAGVKIPFGVTTAEIVAPLSNQYENLNDYSATVKLAWKDTSVLLTGDVEKTSEKEMIESAYDLDVDLLLVPHHGSNSSTTNAFLDKTTPAYAVISCGKDNSYGHPHKEVRARLNKRNIKTYITAELGTIIATLDGETIGFTTVPK